MKAAVKLWFVLFILTGLIYPLSVTGIAGILYPWQTEGSLVVRHGQVVGSQLVGQLYVDTKYFWGRPSATLPMPYNPLASAGSNLGPTSELLLKRIKDRVSVLQKTTNKHNRSTIPIDLVTASASGLDPDISPASAYFQVERIAKSRGLDQVELINLIRKLTTGRYPGILGEERVNVMELNLALDELVPNKRKK